MRSGFRFATASFAALCCAWGSTFAAGKAGAGPDAATFVQKAAQDGMMEVELGRLAQKKASDPEVRSFGARMVKDHGNANDELTSIAKPKGLEVPSELDAKHQGMVDELKSLSGKQFDARYSKMMASGHTEAIQLFTQASHGQDPDLASFAKKTLPTLREHKELADSLASNTRSAAASHKKKGTYER